MRFPGRKELAANDTYAGVARGQQVTADTTRAGVVDDGNIAWPERIDEARRNWPQARAEDFEKIGKRHSRDRGSRIELVAKRGAPLLSVGQEKTRGAACFSWKPAGSSSCVARTSSSPCSAPPVTSRARSCRRRAPAPQGHGSCDEQAAPLVGDLPAKILVSRGPARRPQGRRPAATAAARRPRSGQTARPRPA